MLLEPSPQSVRLIIQYNNNDIVVHANLNMHSYDVYIERFKCKIIKFEVKPN